MVQGLAFEVWRDLCQEVFGYNISYNGPGPDTPSGIFAVAGCTTPENAVDRGCGASVTQRKLGTVGRKFNVGIIGFELRSGSTTEPFAGDVQPREPGELAEWWF